MFIPHFHLNESNLENPLFLKLLHLNSSLSSDLPIVHNVGHTLMMGILQLVVNVGWVWSANSARCN